MLVISLLSAALFLYNDEEKKHCVSTKCYFAWSLHRATDSLSIPYDSTGA